MTSFPILKSGCLTTALAFSAAVASAGAPFDFDHLSDGDAANLAMRAGIRFEPAVFSPDLDSQGLEIPGTDKWRIDYSQPPITVTDPMPFGGGPAPTPTLALDAFIQPTLVVLPGPGDLANFTAILDGNVFGDALEALFLDVDGNILLSLPVDQTVPYFEINSGPIAGVAAVLLPAGAFYDSITVPEANPWAASVTLLALGGWQLRNRRRKQA